MGCGSCCSAERVFINVNIAFAMYAGALLVTSARLTWDPTTYTWFRFLIELHYRITTGYLFCVGIFLLILVYIGSSAVFPSAKRRLRIYFFCTIVLMTSEVVYCVWMVLSLIDWWENSDQAEMIRSGIALQDDVKSLISILEKHHEIPEEVQIAMNEVEKDMPFNGYVIAACLVSSIILQVAALVLSCCLQSRVKTEDETESPAKWRRSDQYMYSIIDKVF